MKIAVLCSGNGTNLQAIIDAVRSGGIRATIALVVSDNPQAFALSRAKKAGIPVLVLDGKKVSSRRAFDEELIRHLERENVELVVLAGYMRILTRRFVQKFRNRIINVHPALLPAFKGGAGVRDALAYGVKVTGATVHFVTEEVDEGPIILQETVPVLETDSEETLLERVHAAEHRIFPEAVRLFTEGRLTITGRRVSIIEPKTKAKGGEDV